LLVSPPPELTGVGTFGKTAALLFGAVMLPSPFSASLYPLNGAAWSLFFELAVNLAFAALLWRLPRKVLLVILAPALLYLCTVVRDPMYLNVGWRWADLAAGCARTLFSFTAGIVIGRTLAGKERRISKASLVLPLLASLPIIIPSTHPKAWTLLAVAAFFPLIVALSATVEPPQFARRAMLGLGAISFPLYAIHWPIAVLVAPFLRSMPVAEAVAIFFGVSLTLAYLAQRLIDDPVQRRLKDWMRGRSLRPTPVITTISPAAR
jgi:peptidoglycan/LPS O-acetylase OafA/YrhL